MPTLPFLVLTAALLYFVASRAGWLDGLAAWLARPRPPRPASTRPPGRGPKRKRPDRLEVFEEFLQDLGGDDSDPEAKA